MGRIERMVELAKLDAERERRQEREAKEREAQRTQQPKDRP